MFAKFFIDRPVFAWVIALVILLGGALALRKSAGLAVSVGGAAGTRHLGRLPRGVGPGGRGNGGRPDRAGNERHRESALHGFRVADRHRHDHADLQARHQSRLCLGGNAEPHQARRGASAGRRATAGRNGDQDGAQLPDDRFPVFAGQEHEQRRSRQLCRRQRARTGSPRARGGRGLAVRHRVLDASLAQAGKTAGLPPVPGRRVAGGARAERPAGHRRTGPTAGRRRPGNERGDRHQEPPVHARGVRQHHRPHQSRWLHACESRTWRGWSWARRTMRFRPASTASRPRPSPSVCRRAPTRWNTVKAVNARMAELARVLPRGHCLDGALRHLEVRRDLHQRSGQDAGRSDGAGLPGDVPVPGEPARHADSHHRRAGRADRRACWACMCSATRSTC